MFSLVVVIAALSSASGIWAQNLCHNQAAYDNLTVSTRTGVFVGNLNDTYPNVRQFKNIAYAKVCPLQSRGEQRC